MKAIVDGTPGPRLATSLRFDDVELDTVRHELRRHGESCRVEPMVFDQLVYVARHPERVLRRDRLTERRRLDRRVGAS